MALLGVSGCVLLLAVAMSDPRAMAREGGTNRVKYGVDQPKR